MATLTQRSFSGGELSPALRSRVDLQKYQTAAATLRNFQVMRYGGASNRSGSQYVGEVKDSSKTVRLIPFVFNDQQTYMLEFGDKYMRVIKNGVYVQETPTASITGVTNANPAVFSFSGALPITVGSTLTLKGGFSSLTNRPIVVTSVSNTVPGTFTAKYVDGTVVNTIGMGAFQATTATKTYELITPYAYTDLPTLQFIQSADVMTFTHHNYKPLDLKRYGDNNWDFTEKKFSPGYPTTVIYGITGPTGSTIHSYRFTTTDKRTGIETLPSVGSIRPITAITKAAPATVASAGHQLVTGQRVRFNTPYMPQLSKQEYQVTVVNANTFTLNESDTTGYYTVGSLNPPPNAFNYNDTNDYFLPLDTVFTGGTPSAASPIVINFPIEDGTFDYANKTISIYKLKNGIYGFLGNLDISTVTKFKDIGLDPDITDLPPTTRNPFDDGQYPATVAYIQQRLVFGNTIKEPEKVWTSRTGKFNDFTTSSPSQDDQAITFTMAGRQVNAVRYLLDVGQFLILTSGGEWVVMGDNGVITPVGINPKQSSYYGSVEGMAPIIIGNSALYVQARGSIIRDLAYNYQSEGYTGNDLTVFSSHLFDKFILKDWCYQQVPHSILWAVRDDGTLLGLTYIKEQQVLAWHRHDTDGAFENVMAIPEGNEDALYAVIRRVVNGRTVRYVERFATRKVLDLRDSKYLDSHLTYDGRNTTSTTLTLSNGTTWSTDELLTLTASASFFVSTDASNQIQFKDFRFTITEYVSATVVRGYAEKNVPLSYRNVATASFTKAVKRLSGLWHLEGKAVSVLGDGYTVSSPNNPNVDTIVVSGGAIVLDKPYGVIQVGLPYVSDLETLDIDTVQSETLADKRMTINRVTLSMEESVGGFVGAQAPSGTEDMIEHLMEIKEREYQSISSGNQVLTGKRDVTVESNWQTAGRIFVRQIDPLPLSILSVSNAGLIPFKG